MTIFLPMEHQAGAAEGSTVYPCAHCGQKNRVERSRAADGPRCGSCKQAVLPQKPVTVTDGTWQELVVQAPVPVLVDFWAPWCGPCRAIAPVLEEIAAARQGRLIIAKLNVDENPHMSAHFDVQAIPTMIIFDGENPRDQIRGALPRPALEARLDRLGI